MSEISHISKFHFWSHLLSCENEKLPAFWIDQNNANETYISMDNAPTKKGEFKKDKSSEQRKDQPRWKATDLSDAMDNLYYHALSDRVGYSVASNEITFIN